VNLASFDPTTYYLLLQFRVVITGVVYQFLFKRQLSAWQWLSLILLTIGCLVKNFGRASDAPGSVLENLVSFSLLLILVQVFCSCFAGVYNEYLLKDSKGQVHLMVQNMYMYIDSIICNVIILIITGNAASAETAEGNSFAPTVSAILEPNVLYVMLNNAVVGIVTSMFLKNLNSILKTFASALELVFTAVACWILFKIPIDLYTVVAIAIVSFATYLYSRFPVVARPIKSQTVKYLPLKDVSREDIESRRSSRSNSIDAV